MSVDEQEQLKEREYAEAQRYMTNAKDCLRKAKKEDNFYQDKKYVKMACGTAYNGVLLALDCFFTIEDIKLPRGKDRRSVEFYRNNLGKIDRKMMSTYNSLYEVLLLLGYYDGITRADVVNAGMEDAYAIIEKIKPKNVARKVR